MKFRAGVYVLLAFLSSQAWAGNPTLVQDGFPSVSVSGNSLVTGAFTAIGVGHAVVGIFPSTTDVTLNSVTDNAGVGNTYSVSTTLTGLVFGGNWAVFAGVNIKGSPTTFTGNFSGTPGAGFNAVGFEEYNPNGNTLGVNAFLNPVHDTNTGTNISDSFTTTARAFLWGFLSQGVSLTSAGSGFTLRLNHSGVGIITEDNLTVQASGSNAITWVVGASASGNIVAGAAISVTPPPSLLLMGVGQ